MLSNADEGLIYDFGITRFVVFVVDRQVLFPPQTA